MSKGVFNQEKVSFNLARLKKEGSNFEVVIDADLAIRYAQGEEVDLKDVLKSEHIFFDAKKGELASDLEKVFGTEDELEIADRIIKKGEIQLTAEHRAKVREQKRNQIVQIIHRNGVDPSTHLPHPLQRIENAIEEAKARIDEHRKAEDQVQGVLKAIRPVLPIKFEVKEIALQIPAVHAAKVYSSVKSFAKILKEDWQSDGSWVCVVEIPGGLESEFFDKLNSITHGEMESKTINTK